MRDLAIDLAAGGGIHRTRTLERLGHSRHRLARAIVEHQAVRPRVGWIAHPDADRVGLRAVALGGRLTGPSALRSLGVWVGSDRGPLVACAPNSARLLVAQPEERRTWRPDRFPDAHGVEWRVSTLDALRDFGVTASPDELIASVDSALHHGLIARSDSCALAAALHSRHRRLPSRVDPKSESGGETHLRLTLRSMGLDVESQVDIPTVGRVDLLVDRWLILEIDSRAHHGSPSDQDRDRTRDGNATILGYATLRFMAMDTLRRSDWCRDVVTARLRSGRPTLSGVSSALPIRTRGTPRPWMS